LGVTVTQQGDKLAAQTQRIDGLFTPLDNTNAAVRTEAKARSDCDRPSQPFYSTLQ